jgi:proteasome lid subunit RPN8/RPN11
VVSKPWFSPEVVDQILGIGLECAPEEACGVVLPNLRVIQLRNCSDLNRETSYEVNTQDLIEIIADYIAESGIEAVNFTRAHFLIWHTHPSGNIGPSHGDMCNRLDNFMYGVVALPSGQATLF